MLEQGINTTDTPGNSEGMSQLTFGEKLCGINFNPANDDKVGKAKRLCADLADLLHDHFLRSSEKTVLENQLHHHAIGEILNAQMNVVKVLTLKY